MNRDDPASRRESRQALSALMDGQGSAADLACRAWRDEPEARAEWHAYHLIGELMRSDDVRCAAQHDAQFLGRLRQRLAAEPVVLAPASPAPNEAPVPRRWHRAWVGPAAVAAGFVAVAGVLVVTRFAAPDGATADPAARVADAAVTPVALSGSSAATADGRLIRNPELDRYLAAHRQYSNTSALAVPGGMVRNAAAAAPNR